MMVRYTVISSPSPISHIVSQSQAILSSVRGQMMVRYTVISSPSLVSLIGPQSQAITISEGPNEGKIYSYIISVSDVSHWTSVSSYCHQ